MGLFDKIKNFAGIDTVNVEIAVNEYLKKDTKSIKGTVIVTGKSEQNVKTIIINLIEKYKYKNSENSIVTTDYQLGKLTIQEGFKIVKDEIKKVEFDLPIEYVLDKGVYSEEEIEQMKSSKSSKFIIENTSQYLLAAVVDVEAAKIDPAGRIELKYEN